MYIYILYTVYVCMCSFFKSWKKLGKWKLRNPVCCTKLAPSHLPGLSQKSVSPFLRGQPGRQIRGTNSIVIIAIVKIIIIVIIKIVIIIAK